MTTQPAALRHADKLDRLEFDEPHGCADELRRLHGEVEALRAQRDALLEVVQKYLAWSAAEDDHKSTTFWERVEMCREVDQLARAAIAKAEGA